MDSDRVSQAPAGWYHLATRKQIRRAPVGLSLGSGRFVGFLDDAGMSRVIDARCVHMNADLARGRVRDGTIECPLHGWRFAGDGLCVAIPAQEAIPGFARQMTYPTGQFGDHVFFYNRPTAPYPLPTYDDIGTDALCPARPFEFEVSAPWYMIPANAFDLQHFRMAHDRLMNGPPTVSQPTELARRIQVLFEVTGKSWRDKLTRRFSGRRVEFNIVVWGGPMILVTAKFPSTTSYGLVNIVPSGPDSCRVRIIVSARRREGTIGGAFISPLVAAIKRSFIRAFLQPDVIATASSRYCPGTLLDIDSTFGDCMKWLISIHPEQFPASLRKTIDPLKGAS